MAEAVQVFVLPLATRKLALQKHWPYKAPILPVRCTPARRAFGVVAQAFSERFESQYPVRYDEYYNGDCLPNERDLAVRDLTWSELTRIKEFQQEDMYSFNCHMKVILAYEAGSYTVLCRVAAASEAHLTALARPVSVVLTTLQHRCSQLAIMGVTGNFSVLPRFSISDMLVTTLPDF